MAGFSIRRKWTEQEIMLAMDLYWRMPFGKIQSKNPDIVKLAQLIDRSPGSVAMKMCNLAHYDPHLQARNVGGLPNGSKLDQKVFERYYGCFDELAVHAYEARRELDPAYALEFDAPPPPIGQRQLSRGLDVKTYVEQDFFRDSVLTAYGDRCCVTGLGIPELLRASHIKPRSECSTAGERTDPRNGLCLNALHGAAFDNGLITIDTDHRVVFSHELAKTDVDSSTKEWLLSTERREILLPDRFMPSETFLEFHRDVVFRR